MTDVRRNRPTGLARYASASTSRRESHERSHLSICSHRRLRDCVDRSAARRRPGGPPSACGRDGRLGPASRLARGDADAGARLRQRPVAVAAGRRGAGQGAGRRVGVLQGAGVLAGHHRLPSKRLAVRLPAPELEGPGPRTDHGGLVPAGGHSPAAVAGTPHRAVRRVPQLAGGRLRGREERGRAALPGRRARSFGGLPSGPEARLEHSGTRPAAQGRHALLHRLRFGERGEGRRRPAGAVRRRLPRRDAARGPDRGREGRHVGPPRERHGQRRAARPGRGGAVHAPRSDYRRRPRG